MNTAAVRSIEGLSTAKSVRTAWVGTGCLVIADLVAAALGTVPVAFGSDFASAAESGAVLVVTLALMEGM